MKKTTKKTASKPRATKAMKDLAVTHAKCGTVRGGIIVVCDQTTPRGKHY